MLFSSAIFVFLFLPVTLLAYQLLNHRLKNILLLIASLLFYAWGEPVYVLLMCLSIVINYVAGLFIGSDEPKKSKQALIAGISINIGLLIYYKYFWFITQNINELFGWNIGTSNPLPLPIGISFYTFQAMSYLVDVYRRQVQAQKSIINLGLYISLFPQLIAGPIVRYKDVSSQIMKRQVSLDGFVEGIQRFIIGLGKKVLLANTMGELADKIFAFPLPATTAGVAWLGVICYAFQIFFDFSGYSDMAIGLGKMFGFTFLENFNYPYISKSLREFWRRWHISLSTWFRDYLYIPLGGNRLSPRRTFFNLLFVFFITGLWHGAEWTFVVWGLFHGCFLLLERGPFGKWLDRAWAPIQHAYVLLVVLVAWVFFRASSLPQAFGYIRVMAGMGNQKGYPFELQEFMNTITWTALALSVLFSLPLENLKNWTGPLALEGSFKLIRMCFLLLIFLLSLSAIASDTYNPFIYFRF